MLHTKLQALALRPLSPSPVSAYACHTAVVPRPGWGREKGSSHRCLARLYGSHIYDPDWVVPVVLDNQLSVANCSGAPHVDGIHLLPPTWLARADRTGTTPGHIGSALVLLPGRSAVETGLDELPYLTRSR
jgi:hypothetical protein